MLVVGRLRLLNKIKVAGLGHGGRRREDLVCLRTSRTFICLSENDQDRALRQTSLFWEVAWKIYLAHSGVWSSDLNNLWRVRDV